MTKLAQRTYRVWILDADSGTALLEPRLLKAEQAQQAAEITADWLEAEGYNGRWRVVIELPKRKAKKKHA
jgi:hypothetical protein